MSGRNKAGQFVKGHKVNIGRRFKLSKPVWNKGKTGVYSDETRKKISQFLSGNKNCKGKHWKCSDEFRQKMSQRIISPETRRKISDSHRGEKCFFWRGGLSKNKEYRYWSKNSRNRVKKRLNDVGSFHTFGEWQTLKIQYNHTCPCCGQSEPDIKLTEDHIIPLSKGGSDLIENIQPLCLNCNMKKHTKIIKYNVPNL